MSEQDASPAVDESTADSTDTEAPEKEAAPDPEKLRKINADLERKLKRSDDNRTRVSELEAQIAELTAKAEGKEAEHQAALEAQRVKDEAIAAANQRILMTEVRAQATGKLQDPTDALKYLDLSTFEVDEDGEVDGDAVASAINDLIESKPYLAVAEGKRFKGDADGGARKETPPARAKNLGEAVARQYQTQRS